MKFLSEREEGDNVVFEVEFDEGEIKMLVNYAINKILMEQLEWKELAKAQGVERK